MSDGDLLVFGCMVSFIAVGGAYVLLRERFLVHGDFIRERRRARRARRASTG